MAIVITPCRVCGAPAYNSINCVKHYSADEKALEGLIERLDAHEEFAADSLRSEQACATTETRIVQLKELAAEILAPYEEV